LVVLVGLVQNSDDRTRIHEHRAAYRLWLAHLRLSGAGFTKTFKMQGVRA
jgi:hypothetical protein